MTERELQGHIIRLARTLGYLVAHFRPALNRRGVWATQMSGDPGWPDLVLVGRGQVLFRELKVGKGRLTSEQKAWREAILLTGGNYEVWTSMAWPERVQAQLEGRAVAA